MQVLRRPVRTPLSATRIVDEMNNACFIVRDKNGQQLGYFYFEEESGRAAVRRHQTTIPQTKRRPRLWRRPSFSSATFQGSASGKPLSMPRPANRILPNAD